MRKPQAFRISLVYETKPEPDDDEMTPSALAHYVESSLAGMLGEVAEVSSIRVEELCGQDYMAGQICMLPKGHEGRHE
jgi:hypothetical protein